MDGSGEGTKLHLFCILNQTGGTLRPVLGHRRVLSSVDEDIEGAGHLQQRKERHRGCDLSYDISHLLSDLLLVLLSRRIFAAIHKILSLDVKLPSLDHFLCLDLGDYHDESLQILRRQEL
ncbi:hypothetical protein PMAYCL1PPCAC_18695 [Pristionchus mayeri]|uniref:Uncharacterized protein n=1 Tax=Pristionchus mayeri TaxID=1317129 RepID=A0AAN5CQ13_9BILA|nr:hypothetical protein PMAYCL1PPCAC_18695 [Pristionchus mayeri]